MPAINNPKVSHHPRPAAVSLAHRFDLVARRGYFCATVGEMTEAMIKEYLEHHFEPDPAKDFKVEP